MPKKLGTNPKAEEARQRKTEKKNADKIKEEKSKQDALWADDDPKLAKKKQQKVRGFCRMKDFLFVTFYFIFSSSGRRRTQTPGTGP